MHTRTTRRSTRRARAALGDVLAAGLVDMGFQPVVDLRSRAVVGYEALVRGPYGSEIEAPDDLFAIARGAGRLDELDWLCQRCALRGALEAGLRGPSVLFLNVEADTSGFMPLDLRALYAEATAEMTVAVEVTERALTQRPAALLGHVADMRGLGCMVALDDVGAEVDSLAMMSVLSPEVVKLDLALLAGSSPARIAEIVDAASAHSERSGATILVERIETALEAELADAVGAQLAQGFLFGRREHLDGPPTPPAGRVVHASPRGDPRDTTPFALLGEARSPRRAGRSLIQAISRRLEAHARSMGHGAVLLGAFGSAARFGGRTRDRYAQIAGEVAFCGVVGEGMAPEPAPGVRGGSLTAVDPLAREWSVVVVSPHLCGALSAHEAGDGESYDYVLTHDRDLAVAAAASLMARVAA